MNNTCFKKQNCFQSFVKQYITSIVAATVYKVAQLLH